MLFVLWYKEGICANAKDPSHMTFSSGSIGNEPAASASPPCDCVVGRDLHGSSSKFYLLTIWESNLCTSSLTTVPPKATKSFCVLSSVHPRDTASLFSFCKAEKEHLHQVIATNVPTSQETSMERKNFCMLGQPKQTDCHQQQARETAHLSSRFLGWPQNISGAKGRTKGRVALGQWPKQ